MTPAEPRPDLKRRTLAGTAKFLIALGVLIVLPSLDLRFWQGWLFWVSFSIFSVAASLYFLKHDPALVERRLAAGPKAETEPTQKRIMTAASVCIIVIFAMPGLDHVFGWSKMPTWVPFAGDAGVLLAYLFVCYVLSVNSYAAATIITGQDQPVIKDGPYRYVRHPMYSGALLMFGLAPIGLGSWWGLLPVIPLVQIMVLRLLDEERILRRDLPGYVDYCTAVRYRLVPGLW